MDNNIIQSLVSGGISSVIVASLYFTYKICKRSRCSSNCCGYRSEMSVSLDSNGSDSKTKPFIV